MPYLSPDLVLRRFSAFARSEVRDALAEGDDEFMSAQVGSLSSTLEFLAKELEGMGAAVDAQRRALDDALDGAAAELDAREVDAPEVRAAIEAADERLADVQREDVYDREEVVTDAAGEVLATVDEELSGDDAKAVRAPLYSFLRTRVESQLEMLGRGGE